MKRRMFLKHSSLFTACALTLNSEDLFARHITPKKIDPFGVQLFSVRDILPTDPKGIMIQLAKMGYKQFESFSGAQGFLWGFKPKELKSFLDGLGVQMLSTHFNYLGIADKPSELKQNIEWAAEAGLKYFICPWIGGQKDWDSWKKVAEQLNKVGEEVTKAGLQFGYHNHDYSFKPLEGKLPQNFLLDNTDPKNVMFELDLCWIDVAGVNTADHLKKYGHRYEICHIKDYKKVDGKPIQKDLGNGSVDIKNILKDCLESGIGYYIVEQEQYPVSPLESLKHNAAYMKKLQI